MNQTYFDLNLKYAQLKKSYLLGVTWLYCTELFHYVVVIILSQVIHLDHHTNYVKPWSTVTSMYDTIGDIFYLWR